MEEADKDGMMITIKIGVSALINWLSYGLTSRSISSAVFAQQHTVQERAASMQCVWAMRPNNTIKFNGDARLTVYAQTSLVRSVVDLLYK